jgi:ryanodine receptor 2
MLLKQRVCIEPCFSFGNVERNRLAGPIQIQHNIAFTPQPVRITNIVVPAHLERVCEQLAENIHELWTMSKIANGWRYGEVCFVRLAESEASQSALFLSPQIRDDAQKKHPCLTFFENLPADEKQHHLTTATDNLKSLLAFGYHIGSEAKNDDRRMKYMKLPATYAQTNGYKPQPLDLSNVTLSTKMDELVEILAENTHNVWTAARIKDGFTYGVSDVSRKGVRGPCCSQSTKLCSRYHIEYTCLHEPISRPFLQAWFANRVVSSFHSLPVSYGYLPATTIGLT